MMRHRATALLLAGVLWAGPVLAEEPAAPLPKRTELTDAELDLVTAGAAAEAESSEEIVRFAARKVTASGREVTAEGTLQVLDAATSHALEMLILGDGAQGNLRSLVNINAVNSTVNVLLNLNVNIDSQVGRLEQINLNGTVPGIPIPRTIP